MTWISPNSHLDSGGGWTDEIDAYDGNLETEAYNAFTKTNRYLELILGSPISCDKIQVYINWGTDSDAVEVIDVYYNLGWHNIYSGTLSESAWVEIPIGSIQLVSKAQIKQTVALKRLYLTEFQFWEVEAVAYTPQVIMIQCSPIAKKNGIYRRLKKLWVPQLRKLWLPTPPVCVPKRIMVP